MTAFRSRDVRLLVGAVGCSSFGDFLLWVPLALHIEATTGSALAVSAFFLALFGPVVALGGLAGRLADRVENARLLWRVSLAQAVVVGAMALCTGSLAAILALTVLLGAGVALSQPAEFALVPAAAGEERGRRGERPGRDRALRGHDGRAAARRRAGRGRACSRSRCCWTPPRSSPSPARPWRCAPAATRAPRAPVTGDGGRARDGVAFLTRDRVLRVTLAASVAALLFFSISIAAELFFVTDVLAAGDAAYGVLVACWTLGMVAGAVGLARRVPARALAVAALAGIAVQGAGIASAAAAGVLWAAFARLRARRGGPRRQERGAAHAHPPAGARGAAAAAPSPPTTPPATPPSSARWEPPACSIGAIGAQPALLLAGARAAGRRRRRPAARRPPSVPTTNRRTAHAYLEG